MEEVQAIETVAEGGLNPNVIKVGAIILGVGAIIGAAYGIKKLIDRHYGKPVVYVKKQEQVNNPDAE